MPYQQFSEKLMVLDREEEAKRMMNGAQNQDFGGYGGVPQGNAYDLNQQQFQPQAPNMDDISAPTKVRKMAAAAKP